MQHHFVDPMFPGSRSIWTLWKKKIKTKTFLWEIFEQHSTFLWIIIPLENVQSLQVATRCWTSLFYLLPSLTPTTFFLLPDKEFSAISFGFVNLLWKCCNSTLTLQSLTLSVFWSNAWYWSLLTLRMVVFYLSVSWLLTLLYMTMLSL